MDDEVDNRGVENWLGDGAEAVIDGWDRLKNGGDKISEVNNGMVDNGNEDDMKTILESSEEYKLAWEEFSEMWKAENAHSWHEKGKRARGV